MWAYLLNEKGLLSDYLLVVTAINKYYYIHINVDVVVDVDLVHLLKNPAIDRFSLAFDSGNAFARWLPCQNESAMTTTTSINILIIDNNVTDFCLLSEMLRDGGLMLKDRAR